MGRRSWRGLVLVVAVVAALALGAHLGGGGLLDALRSLHGR